MKAKRFLAVLAAVAIVLLLGVYAVTGSQQQGGVSTASQAAGSAASAGAASEASSTAGSAAAGPESEAASAASLTRAQTSVVEFFIEGETEHVPSTLYVGKGYSLYVPDEGWKVTESTGSRTTWISTDNDTVGFSVSAFTGTSAAAARSEYIAGSGFDFDDLNGGDFGDPLLGWSEDGDALGIMSAEKNGTVYIIAWTYPMEATEGFGARLAQIADTFEVM